MVLPCRNDSIKNDQCVCFQEAAPENNDFGTLLKVTLQQGVKDNRLVVGLESCAEYINEDFENILAVIIPFNLYTETSVGFLYKLIECCCLERKIPIIMVENDTQLKNIFIKHYHEDEDYKCVLLKKSERKKEESDFCERIFRKSEIISI